MTELSPASLSNPVPSPALLRLAFVCEQLQVWRSWLYAAAEDGRIPAIRLGSPDGPLRFVAEDLTAWLDEARSCLRPRRTPAAADRSRRKPSCLRRPRLSTRSCFHCQTPATQRGIWPTNLAAVEALMVVFAIGVALAFIVLAAHRPRRRDTRVPTGLSHRRHRVLRG